MNAEGLAELRKPFPPESVGKLPRTTQKEGQKSKCSVCGNYLPPHIHLDFVGHAMVTDRLLTIDPEWSWEPVGFDADGLPALRRGSNETVLWIRLTILGVTRLGVGSVANNSFELEKQLVGDAIRNAAMRFGVALDLWSKEELESQVGDEDRGGGAGDRKAPERAAAAPVFDPPSADLHCPDCPVTVSDAASLEVHRTRRHAKTEGGSGNGDAPSAATSDTPPEPEGAHSNVVTPPSARPSVPPLPEGAK